MALRTSTGDIDWICPSCETVVPGTAEDARVSGEVHGSSDTTAMYDSLLRHSAFDETNQLVARDCACGRDYMTQVRVGVNERIIYTCRCGARVIAGAPATDAKSPTSNSPSTVSPSNPAPALVTGAGESKKATKSDAPANDAKSVAKQDPAIALANDAKSTTKQAPANAPANDAKSAIKPVGAKRSTKPTVTFAPDVQSEIKVFGKPMPKSEATGIRVYTANIGDTDNSCTHKTASCEHDGVRIADSDSIQYLLDAEAVVIRKPITLLVIDYPLAKPVCVSLKADIPDGFTRGALVKAICGAYRAIYDEEEKTSTVPANLIADSRGASTLLNRVTTDGKYKIWGHDIADLVLMDIYWHAKENICTLIIDS